MSHVLLPTLFLSLAHLAPQPVLGNTAGLISTDEMKAMLSEQLQAMDGLTLHFQQTQYTGFGATAPPVSGPAQEHFLLRTNWEAVFQSDKYRQQSRVAETGESFSGSTDRIQIMTWDGQQARIKIHDPEGPLTHSGQIDPAPTRSLFIEPHMSWQGWWIYQSTQRTSYLDLLSSDELAGPERLADGTTRWHLPYGGSRQLMIELIARRVGDRIELAESTLRGYHEVQWVEGDDPRVVMKIRFGPIRHERGEPLASSAIITTHHLEDEPSKQLWGYTEVKLDHVEHIAPMDGAFRVKFDPAATISDARYRIAYTLGESMLNLDGRILSTAEPLHGEVGENLTWWLKNGAFVSEAGNQESDSQAVRADIKPGSWNRGWTMLIITGILVLIIFVAKRSPT